MDKKTQYRASNLDQIRRLLSENPGVDTGTVGDVLRLQDEDRIEAHIIGLETGRDEIRLGMSQGRVYPNPLHREQVGTSTLAASMHRLQCAADNFNAAARAMLDGDFGVEAIEVNDRTVADGVMPVDPLSGLHVVLSPQGFTSTPPAPPAKGEGGQDT